MRGPRNCIARFPLWLISASRIPRTQENPNSRISSAKFFSRISKIGEGMNYFEETWVFLFFISRDTTPLFPLFLESNLLLENLGNYRISHACSFDKISYPSYRAIQRRTKLFVVLEFVTQLWKLAFLPPRYILHIPRIVDRERGGFHPWTGLKLPRRNGEGRSRGPLELFGSTLAPPLLLETPRDKKVPRRRGVCPSTNLGWISTRRMLVEENRTSWK